MNILIFVLLFAELLILSFVWYSYIKHESKKRSDELARDYKELRGELQNIKARVNQIDNLSREMLAAIGYKKTVWGDHIEPIKSNKLSDIKVTINYDKLHEQIIEELLKATSE